MNTYNFDDLLAASEAVRINTQKLKESRRNTARAVRQALADELNNTVRDQMEFLKAQATVAKKTLDLAVAKGWSEVYDYPTVYEIDSPELVGGAVTRVSDTSFVTASHVVRHVDNKDNTFFEATINGIETLCFKTYDDPETDYAEFEVAETDDLVGVPIHPKRPVNGPVDVVVPLKSKPLHIRLEPFTREFFIAVDGELGPGYSGLPALVGNEIVAFYCGAQPGGVGVFRAIPYGFELIQRMDAEEGYKPFLSTTPIPSTAELRFTPHGPKGWQTNQLMSADLDALDKRRIMYLAYEIACENDVNPYASQTVRNKQFYTMLRNANATRTPLVPLTPNPPALESWPWCSVYTERPVPHQLCEPCADDNCPCRTARVMHHCCQAEAGDPDELELVAKLRSSLQSMKMTFEPHGKGKTKHRSLVYAIRKGYSRGEYEAALTRLEFEGVAVTRDNIELYLQESRDYDDHFADDEDINEDDYDDYMSDDFAANDDDDERRERNRSYQDRHHTMRLHGANPLSLPVAFIPHGKRRVQTYVDGLVGVPPDPAEILRLLNIDSDDETHKPVVKKPAPPLPLNVDEVDAVLEEIANDTPMPKDKAAALASAAGVTKKDLTTASIRQQIAEANAKIDELALAGVHMDKMVVLEAHVIKGKTAMEIELLTLQKKLKLLKQKQRFLQQRQKEREEWSNKQKTMQKLYDEKVKEAEKMRQALEALKEKLESDQDF